MNTEIPYLRWHIKLGVFKAYIKKKTLLFPRPTLLTGVSDNILLFINYTYKSCLGLVEDWEISYAVHYILRFSLFLYIMFLIGVIKHIKSLILLLLFMMQKHVL